MADTGPPWNIPYVEPADLVRQYPAADEAQALAIAAGLSAAGNPGIGSNVVQTVKTDTFSASVASGAESGDVTGLTVTITPTTNTSKILIVPMVTIQAAAGGTGFTLYRDSSVIVQADASGSISRLTAGAGRTDDIRGQQTTPFFYVDSPLGTAAVTYSVRIRHSSSGAVTVYVNRGSDGTNAAANLRSTSSITAIEVAP